MSIKLKIKKHPVLRNIVPAYRFIRSLHIRARRGMSRHPSMLEGELKLFKAIYSQCKSIVDVGTRYDVDYISISKNNNILYFLFEANPKFYRILCNKLKEFNENITAENFAIGERNGYVEYYEDAESVLKTTTAVFNSKKKLCDNVKMIRLDEYFVNAGIKQIDFLKVDIEEYDYFALIGLGHLLNNCRYIQFELGIGAPLNNGAVSNKDYYDLLEENFDLYLVMDENNPLWKKGLIRSDLLKLDENSKKIIEIAQKSGVGFNVFCVNRNLKTDIESLTRQSSLALNKLQGGIF